MSVCPITLAAHTADGLFSPEGLRSLHPRLKQLNALPLTHEEQIIQARLRAEKMSIQGIQPKLSAKINLKTSCFDLTDTGGTFILKPNPTTFKDVPANEALTMTMAKHLDIEVPPHGIIPDRDGSWVYVIKRFDRLPKQQKIHTEDFAQLTLASRDTKYDSSLEKVAQVITDFCTFPAVERPQLALRLIFCFLTGNEDMHLKNFSLIRDPNDIVRLSPAYDLLNTTLVLENAVEETALPIGGKKRNLSRRLWLHYLTERLMLSDQQTGTILRQLTNALPEWRTLISHSYLPPKKQQSYLDLLEQRARVMGLI